MDRDELNKSVLPFNSTSAGWPVFEIRIIRYIRAKEWEHLISRKDDIPPATASEEMKKLYKKQSETRVLDDAKLQTILFSKLPDNVVNLVSDKVTSYEVMETLRQQYDSKSAATMMGKMSRLFDIMYTPGADMGTHVGEMNALVLQLQHMGDFNWDKFRVVLLLRSMPKNSDWEPVVQALKQQDDKTLTIDRVIAAFNQRADELKKGTSTGSSVPKSSKAAFQMTQNGGRGGGKSIICDNCHKPGHTKKQCWQEGGGAAGKGPRQQRFDKKPKEEQKGAFSADGERRSYAFSATGPSHNTTTDEDPDVWRKDSAATDHFTCRMDVFKTFFPMDDLVTPAGGPSLNVKGRGSVDFESTLSDGSKVTITLLNVYYVPDMIVNLVSTASLNIAGLLQVQDTPLVSSFRKQDGTEVMTAKLMGRQWVMNLSAIIPDKSAMLVSGEILHRRLGHLNEQAMVKLNGMVDGYEYKGDIKGEMCEICAINKSVSAPHPTSTNPTSKHPLDLIHMDYVEIEKDSGVEGETTTLLITDDHSNARWAFPMKTRSGEELLKQFKAWLPTVERMADRKLKIIRSDRDLSIVAGVFGDFMEEMGIAHQLTPAYEHQSNGKAERANRIILDRARCMLQESKLPKKYWPYAVTSAVYVVNRSPSSGLDVTPLEKFSDQRPDLRNMRVFGSTCYARYPVEHSGGRHKLDPRASKCRFLTYGSGGGTYYVMAENGKIFLSRNVKFDETDTGEIERRINDDGEFLFDGGDLMDDDEDMFFLLDESTGEPTLPEPERNLRPKSKIPIPTAASPRPVRNTRPPDRLTIDNRKRFAHAVQAFLVTTKNYKSLPDAEMWEAAIEHERVNILETYDVVERLEKLPPNGKVIPSQLLLQRGREQADGTPGKYKARFVGGGDHQKLGVDVWETFAPVANPSSIRTILVIANKRKLKIRQGDVPAAFLHADMDGEVIIRIPEIWAESERELGAMFWRLRKALYGTKQAGRLWRKLLKEFLLLLGLKPLIWDSCVFTRGSFENGDMLILVVWVDDIIVVHDDKKIATFNEVWDALKERFNIKDLGELDVFVGMKITRDIEGGRLAICQSNYFVEALKDFKMDVCTPRITPMQPNQRLASTTEAESIVDKPMRKLVGQLMYPTVWSRPDIAYAVGTISQHLVKPAERHWKAGMDLLRYVQGTKDMSLNYHAKEELVLEAWADSDWAGDTEKGRSVYGYLVTLGGNLVSWKSKKHSATSSSSTTAELTGLYQATIEVVWMRGLLSELGYPQTKPTVVYQDNSAAIAIVKGEKDSTRLKHETVKLNVMRDYFRNGVIELVKTPTEDMIADIMTKSLGKVLFQKHRDEMGIY